MHFMDRDKFGMYKHASPKGPGPSLMGADTLMGESVVNAQGLSLGDIKEIMLDMRTGQVAYAVLAFGGFLGLGEKLFAVPWQAMRLDTAKKCFVLDVDKERLKTAPGFNSHAWPDMTDVAWTNQVHAFYGTDPGRSGSMASGVPMNGRSAAPRAVRAPAWARRWAAAVRAPAAAQAPARAVVPRAAPAPASARSSDPAGKLRYPPNRRSCHCRNDGL